MEPQFTTLTPSDLPAIRALFASSNDIPYNLAAVAEEKCFGRGAGGDPLCLGTMRDGELAGVLVVSGRFIRILCVSRKHRRDGIGSAMIRRAEQHARELHAKRLLISGEPANYFVPGIPKDDTASMEWLERHGFHAENVAVHLSASLDDLPPIPAVAAEIIRAEQSMRPAVERFITATFSPLWTLEVTPAWDRHAPPLFVALVDGDVVGFSAHEVNNRGLGFYGPAGVVESRRRGGVGRALLLSSLHDLRHLGFHTAVIPWVSSVEFYEKVAGARVAQSFVTYSKKL